MLQLLLLLARLLSGVIIDDGNCERQIAVCLSALEQVLDVNVGVRKGVPAESNVIHRAQCDIRAVPD